jgi:hypothetical protein
MIAFRYLPVASLPLVDLSAIQVSAALPGASLENMASEQRARILYREQCLLKQRVTTLQPVLGSDRLSARSALLSALDEAGRLTDDEFG